MPRLISEDEIYKAAVQIALASQHQLDEKESAEFAVELADEVERQIIKSNEEVK